MSALRFLTKRGFSSRAIALLMAMAMIAAGIGFPPASLAGTVVASADDQQPDSQPCEESPEESAEDEESSAGKHAAVLGYSLALDPATLASHGVAWFSSWFPAGFLASSTPIRGPPAAA